MPSASSDAAPLVPLSSDAKVMGLVGLAHASSHFSHLLLPLLFPILIRDFGWSYAELGLLSTLFFVVSGVGQASAGFVVDRFGARPVLFASMVLFTLACLLASVAQGYAALMGVAVLAGLGNAPFHPVDFTILNQRVSTPRLGYAFSAHGLSGNLGWAVAPVFFTGLGALWGWREAFVAAAVMYAALLLLLWVYRDDLHTDASARPQAGQVASQDLNFVRLPVVWWCFAFFLLSTVTLAVVQNFSVPILKALHGVSLEVASMTLTAYMLCGALGMLAGGFVAARWPRLSDRVVAICMTCAALLMAVCASGFFGQTGTLWVLAATGFAVGVGGPSRDLMIKKATPKGATGRVYGLVYSGLDVGFALSPIFFGALMDHGHYQATLLGAALVLLLSVVAALGVGKRTLAQA
ncbi:MFS transporter [Limnohabitans lacus]|uniref:MFS transporter n=1 Tax=Limnohabitans lacus TaxID=3045173 RepID=A0ABT6X3J9_9BURK|nr:MFS transporter [Limnohabitans sp. HM2-2]MDI9232639.1 MFS transporter [Limnohabitans sp. HM2-2]